MKEELIKQFYLTTANVETATSPIYHIVMALEILSIPPEVEGDIIECGCWKGGSTANLSLVCKLVGRRLIVCDSFEGLPEEEERLMHHYPHLKVYGYYERGMYTAQLDEVKENITRYGDISVCKFVPGFFSETLKILNSQIVFAFIDVDLGSSMKDCIKYIWPLLGNGSKVYTDDSCDMEVVKVWFDDVWWNKEMNQVAPGYVGSGCGLPLSPKLTSLGYAVKVLDPAKDFNRVSWLSYPDEEKVK